MIEEFFNKSKYIVSKLSDQIDIQPDLPFMLPVHVVDMITFVKPTTVSAKLIKVVGRDSTELPTVVTVASLLFDDISSLDQIVSVDSLSGLKLTVSATPALVDWDGKTSLVLKVLIDGTQSVLLPLVQKG